MIFAWFRSVTASWFGPNQTDSLADFQNCPRKPCTHLNFLMAISAINRPFTHTLMQRDLQNVLNLSTWTNSELLLNLFTSTYFWIHPLKHSIPSQENPTEHVSFAGRLALSWTLTAHVLQLRQLCWARRSPWQGPRLRAWPAWIPSLGEDPQPAACAHTKAGCWVCQQNPAHPILHI